LNTVGAIVGPLTRKAFDFGPFGRQWGWRGGYVVVSMIAVVASLGSFFVMPKVPQHELPDEEKRLPVARVAKQEIFAMIGFFKYPTFVLMICQGMFGSIPWLVLGNNQLYWMLCKNNEEAYVPVQLMGWLGVPGGLLGGWISDSLNKVIGPTARPLTAVITVGISVPCLLTLYMILPPEDLTQFNFCVIMAIFNLFGTWAQPGCNFPVMGQIVTSANRNKIICWEMAFENSMAAIMGSNLPYFLNMLLGFEEVKPDGFPDLDLAKQLALLQALATCVPWTLCFFIYIGLMFTFPRDLERIAREKNEGLETQLGKI